MIEILPESTETSIGFKVSGKIEAADYEVLVASVNEAIDKHRRVNLLALMGGYEGVKGFDTIKADFSFGTQEYRQVDKAAFVGEKTWHEWIVKIMDPFTRRVDERYFELDQLDEAWEWVKEE